MAYVAGPPHKSHREEGTGLQVFFPAHAHQLLVEVYGNHFHHNYGTHLDRDMSGNAIWQRHWWRLAAQMSRWYATPTRDVGRRFTMRLDAEWQGFRNRRWNS